MTTMAVKRSVLKALLLAGSLAVSIGVGLTGGQLLVGFYVGLLATVSLTVGLRALRDMAERERSDVWLSEALDKLAEARDLVRYENR